MNRSIMLFFFLIIAIAPSGLWGNSSIERDTRFAGSVSAGYVFKNDCTFKDVYGHGMINALTADWCYYPWQMWGIGAKISYWRAHGRTTFLKRCTLVQEVPVTVYARLVKDFDCGLQAYVSLGGGITWIKEKSYLGHAHVYKGIGEIEVGLSYAVWRCLNLVSAFRYIFPPQSQQCDRVDVGGCDLRAGIGVSF